jgi:hypothetical protein
MNASCAMEDCKIRDNRTGIKCFEGAGRQCTFVRCEILGNQFPIRHGLMEPSLTDCTIDEGYPEPEPDCEPTAATVAEGKAGGAGRKAGGRKGHDSEERKQDGKTAPSLTPEEKTALAALRAEQLDRAAAIIRCAPEQVVWHLGEWEEPLVLKYAPQVQLKSSWTNQMARQLCTRVSAVPDRGVADYAEVGLIVAAVKSAGGRFVCTLEEPHKDIMARLKTEGKPVAILFAACGGDVLARG